jgi:AcrR family transcriptional regulator
MKKEKCVLGRPRSFDADEALERALEVFRQKGYEGASLTDLTEAMGINRPSLYAAFGNKEALFRKALDRYSSGPASYIQAALAAPTAREMAEKLIHGAVCVQTTPGQAAGCLSVTGALACSDEAQKVRAELVARRAAKLSDIRERLERARTEGDLPPDADPATLARYIATVTEGMAVQAASGATREELLQVAEMVLAGWPSK